MGHILILSGFLMGLLGLVGVGPELYGKKKGENNAKCGNWYLAWLAQPHPQALNRMCD